MKIVTLLQPPRIVIGDGCAPQCADYLAQRGVKRVLLVSSKSVLPGLKGVREALTRTGVSFVTAPEVAPEPTRAMFAAVLSFARNHDIDGVLAIGGGSVIDVAKLVAALARGKQADSEVFGINLVADRVLPLVCLPTTAGTGAEVSPNAVLLDEAEEMKKAVISPHLVPDAAYIDPLLSMSVPATVTAATGLDALTHCIEAFANKAAHPAVDLYALQGIRLIAANLQRAVRDGKDTEARGQMALGSFYGGMCLGPVNTAAVHALSYPLGGRFHIAHGVSNAVLLPNVLRFNLPAATDRYADISVALGVKRNGSTESTASAGVEFLSKLSVSCGVPQRMSDFGVRRDAIPWMARTAMQVQRLLKNNPRAVTEADAVGIYEATF